MVSKVVVGAQWGDEGKAKITDYLAENADIVTKFNGGANSGHTTVKDLEGGERIKFVSHLLPDGGMQPGKTLVIGNGVVVEPEQLMSEVRELEGHGIDVRDRLYISKNAHFVMPYHIELDKGKEIARGKNKIGTTCKGIGPTYTDKAARSGIRIEDALDKGNLENLLNQVAEEENYQLAKFGMDPIDVKAIAEKYHAFANEFKDKIIDTSYFLKEAREQGKNILHGGSQATFLDIDHGTYPFVTSSNATAAAACTGTGVGPKAIDEVIGIVKAYTTRVGEGGFPTELGPYEITKKEQKMLENQILDLKNRINSGKADEREIGAYIRAIGAEYGATTGRPRRCGWLDGVMLRKSTNVNSLSNLAITKLDVLDTLDEIKICTSYEVNGKSVNEFPTNANSLWELKPVYETMPGWKENISDIRDYNKLPSKAQDYLKRIEKVSGTPISIVSVGPERSQTIVR